MPKTPHKRGLASARRLATASRAQPPAAGQRGLAVEFWPTHRPLPSARNVRLCPAAAIDKVATSIAAYGFGQPIVVDSDGVIIAGHTRWLAAKQLGLATVPVHVAVDLSPSQVKAYRLADSRTAEETAWDLELLSAEIGELAALEYDLDLLGFERDELAELLPAPNEGLTDPDALPEPPLEPITRPGDLWILGEHRLLCGDATKAAAVKRWEAFSGQEAVRRG